MRRFALLACAMSVALVCLVGVQAHAEDSRPQGAVPGERPPKAVLMKGEKELQKGRLGTYCGASWGCADWFFNFPDPGTTVRVGAGSTLHIRIKYAEQPDSVGLGTGSKLDKRGEWYVGPTRPLATSLKPVVQDGQTVAWDAFFSVKRPGRHYYLSFGAYWVHLGLSHDAHWGFHVQTRP